jgi:hypothetical protein
MDDDRVFPDFSTRGLGLGPWGVGQTGDLGPASGSDGGNSLISGGAEGGTETSNLLGPGGADPTYSGTDLGSGGTSGGGGAVGPGASSTGTSASGGGVSSALASLTSGSNVPLLIGGIAVLGGLGAIAYYAHRGHVQRGKSKSLFHRHAHAHH